MYVARRPSMDQVARGQAHQQALDLAVAERATYARGWRTVGGVGEPSIGSSFSNSVGEPLAFFRETEGFVVFSGQCDYTGPVDYTNYYTVFVLPVGYRPGKQLRIFEAASSAVLLINTTGEILFRLALAYNFRTVRLDGIRFRTN